MFPTIERPPRRSTYSSAMRYPAAGDSAEPRCRADPLFAVTALLGDLPAALVAFAARTGAGVPAASRSATRVSARSTLTSTCFFNFNQSFDVRTGRAPCVGDSVQRAARECAHRAAGPPLAAGPAGPPPPAVAPSGGRRGRLGTLPISAARRPSRTSP